MAFVRTVSATVCLWGYLLCAVALADQTTAAYDDSLTRALSAHAAGDYETARTFMERAHALEPSARTLRGLGIIAYAQQRYAEAVAALASSLSSPIRPLTSELRTSVESLLAQTFQRIGRVRLSIEPDNSVVLVDGAPPLVHAPDELLLPPGHHHVQITAPARTPYELDLTIDAGLVETLHVVLVERSAPPARQTSGLADSQESKPSVSARPPAHEASLSFWRPTVRNSALVGGGALALSGVSVWLAAWRRFKRLDAACSATPVGSCTASDARQRFEAAHIEPLSRGGVALASVGLATLGVSLTLSLLARRERPPPTLLVATQGISLQHAF
jgi:hypothetical protein